MAKREQLFQGKIGFVRHWPFGLSNSQLDDVSRVVTRAMARGQSVDGAIACWEKCTKLYSSQTLQRWLAREI